MLKNKNLSKICPLSYMDTFFNVTKNRKQLCVFFNLIFCVSITKYLNISSDAANRMLRGIDLIFPSQPYKCLPTVCIIAYARKTVKFFTASTASQLQINLHKAYSLKLTHDTKIKTEGQLFRKAKKQQHASFIRLLSNW